ncbi:hypothetical protein POTOM_059305 [Populus tomentosa]|uniref:C-JID domain-containing protein n=1 Tax=Populus tomentosa TaxID=118781 RepID=A0A8X7XTY8_POPTO|nr:hypothetical protein POTOM_059305 [Populus tomentosa]
MSRLRLLRIRNACFDSGPEYLSNELRFLEWRYYPSKSLPSSFQPENLVEVHLCYSNLRQLRLGNKGPLNLIESFSVVIPGSEIPSWFSHQSEGSSVSVQTPPQSLENDEWLGYAVCASLEFDGCASSETYADFPCWVFLVPMLCLFNGDRYGNMMSVFPIGFGMEWKLGNISSDHLWYLFFPSRFKIFDRHVSFRFETYWPQIKVIKCGVRPVYHQDVEGLNRMTNPYENSTFKGVDECFQESGGSTMRGGGALVKRLGHTNDVGETSGSVSSDEQPPTKKLKQI